MALGPPKNSERIERMHQKITDALQPSHLDIIDESAAHIGHAGAQSGAGHFAIIIASPKFEQKTLLEKHRLIYEALDDMMQNDIHALRIELQDT